MPDRVKTARGTTLHDMFTLLFNASQTASAMEWQGADDAAVRAATDYLLGRIRDMAEDALSTSWGEACP